jgi:hypothetical protein
MKFWRTITQYPRTSIALCALMFVALTGMSYTERLLKVVDIYCNTLTCASVGSFGSILIGGDVKIPTLTEVTLTSPTVTFSAVNKHFIDLTADANLTGIYPTGGTLRQVLFIHSGTGSNTMRLDDGTSMTIGGNITLTEGQGDWLMLRCTSADGDEWERIGSADN